MEQGNTARSLEDSKAAGNTSVTTQASSPGKDVAQNQTKEAVSEKKGKKKDVRHETAQDGKGRRRDAKSRRRASTADSDSSDEDDLSSDDSDSSEPSASEKKSKKNARRRRLRKVGSAKLAKSSKSKSRPRKSRAQPDDSSSSDFSSDSSPSSDESGSKTSSSDDGKSGAETTKELRELRDQIQLLQQQVTTAQPTPAPAPQYPAPMVLPMHGMYPYGYLAAPVAPAQNPPPAPETPSPSPSTPEDASGEDEKNDKAEQDKDGKPKFRRVDFYWDAEDLTWKTRDTADSQSQNEEDEDNVFLVRRVFDSQGRFQRVFVDIHSKVLKECIKEVMGEIKGANLVVSVPKIDPDFLFLYMDDLRALYKQLKTTKPTGDSKREKAKNAKKLELKILHLKVLLQYLRKDYKDVRRQVDSLARKGLITFDLLWTLWKPKSLMYTTTYLNEREPRVFRLSYAERHSDMDKGEFYYVCGKYFDFNGKNFGYGETAEEVGAFRGARRITSLPCYPLKYHRDEAGTREKLTARGKKFVELCGMHYKSYSGMAYSKSKKHGLIKFDISQSRVMVDAKTFRRINPNYILEPLCTTMRSSGGRDDSDDDGYNSYGSDGGYDSDNGRLDLVESVYEDDGKDGQAKEDTSDSCGKDTPASSGADTDGKGDETVVPRGLTDEDYILASPIVLGFAFAEKQWLEFPVSGIHEIKWNDQAWDSLVLEPETKDLIKALVTSRRNNASKTIDDVIQGKGKGLVTVLHGSPGTGKTLTAEGISELLKCPLYMVSAGELGTDSRFLEAELQRILDICHAWGAVLLLDEADVFLEKRNIADIHRNALVSIFLRQLEYFQGILFLTTNRVETFDEAFQSRIHIALRYERLDGKAKRKIFALFLGRIRALGALAVEDLTEEQMQQLTRHDLNGREIKNVVSSAQDLAMSKGERLGMKHLQQVLDVHAKFGRDLKGGSGYEEAMRSYF